MGRFGIVLRYGFAIGVHVGAGFQGARPSPVLAFTMFRRNGNRLFLVSCVKTKGAVPARRHAAHDVQTGTVRSVSLFDLLVLLPTVQGVLLNPHQFKKGLYSDAVALPSLTTG